MGLSSVELKQEIMRLNNALNINMYGVGLRRQRVVLADDKTILIIADNKRIPALAALDQRDKLMTRFIDVALLSDFKLKLTEELTSKLNLQVKAVFKDYDPVMELAVTTILLD